MMKIMWENAVCESEIIDKEKKLNTRQSLIGEIGTDREIMITDIALRAAIPSQTVAVVMESNMELFAENVKQSLVERNMDGIVWTEWNSNALKGIANYSDIFMFCLCVYILRFLLALHCF